MPFDYSKKGWPATMTLGGTVYSLSSCDKDDKGLVYSIGRHDDHVTIHGADKEGPDDWRFHAGHFHVRVSNKLFEYDKDGQPDDFAQPGGKKTTGMGAGKAKADRMAADFAKAAKAAATGR